MLLHNLLVVSISRIICFTSPTVDDGSQPIRFDRTIQNVSISGVCKYRMNTSIHRYLRHSRQISIILNLFVMYSLFGIFYFIFFNRESSFNFIDILVGFHFTNLLVVYTFTSQIYIYIYI